MPATSRLRSLPGRLLVVAWVVALAACGPVGGAASGQSTSTAPDGLSVVATTSIVGDIVANVVGDAGTVQVVLPPGTDPHDFAPSAADIARLGEADLVVANGLGLEEGLADALAAAEADGTPVFELATAYDTLLDAEAAHARHEEPGDEESGHEESGHEESGHGDAHDGDETGHEESGHAHDGADPHIWFDPRQMAEAVLALGDALAAVDDGGATGTRDTQAWQSRARAYHDDLLATDAEVADILDSVPPERRVLVTSHDNLGYLAARYGFEIVGAAIPSTSTTAESSAGQLAELAELLRARDVPAVFADSTGSDSLARTLAAEAGTDIEVVALLTDALAPPGTAGDTYQELLRTDARRIAEALSPEPSQQQS